MTKRKEGQPPHIEQTKLPVPSEGTLDQIGFEILTDRTKFIAEALGHMRSENRYLCNHFITSILATPNRDIALDWILIYYELNSRAGRVSGIRIVEVSQETIDRMASLRERELEPLLNELHEIDPKSIEHKKKKIELSEAIERIDAEDERIKESDAGRSNEIAKFWVYFNLMKVGRLLENEETGSFEHGSAPLKFIAGALHEQIKTNQAKLKSPRI